MLGLRWHVVGVVGCGVVVGCAVVVVGSGVVVVGSGVVVVGSGVVGSGVVGSGVVVVGSGVVVVGSGVVGSGVVGSGVVGSGVVVVGSGVVVVGCNTMPSLHILPAGHVVANASSNAARNEGHLKYSTTWIFTNLAMVAYGNSTLTTFLFSTLP
jgi:hypothetical protein